MEKKISDSEKLDRVHDKNMNACSAYDCTGLIPSAITDESEAESYEQLYPYRVPTADDKNKE
ncbi:MAG: hypothetical protein ACI4G0_00060 [Ruminococcus sp.]